MIRPLSATTIAGKKNLIGKAAHGQIHALHASLDAKSCSPALLSAISGNTIISCGCKAINLLTGRLRMLPDLAWLFQLV
jgi:hypothetical protein